MARSLALAGFLGAVAVLMAACAAGQPAGPSLSAMSMAQLESAFRTTRQHTGDVQRSAQARAIRSEAVRRMASWSPSERVAVMDGRIWAGASKDHAWWAWGPPTRVKRSVQGALQREVWSYDISRVAGSNSIYQRQIVLHNGRVVRWSAEQ